MKKYILVTLLTIAFGTNCFGQDLLQVEAFDIESFTQNEIGPTTGMFFNPAGFAADETVRLYVDISTANPNSLNPNMDVFLFIFDGGGSIDTEMADNPAPQSRLTRIGESDIFFIDVDLASGGLFDTERIADGQFVRFLLKNMTFSDGQSGDFEVRFSSVEIPDQAVFTIPERFTVEDSVSIFLNSDLAFGENGAPVGELTGQTDVFMWSGANNFTLTPAGQDDFSQAFEPGRMEVLSENLFRISISIRDYYGLTEEVAVSDITLLFKNTDGSLSGRSIDGNFVIDVESTDIPEIAVTVFPSNFTADDLVTITFDAKFPDDEGNTSLLAQNEIYLFSGVSIVEGGDGFAKTPEGQEFLAPVGPGLMRALGDRVYSISVIPRKYFGLEEDEQIFEMSLIFRSPNGDIQTTPNFVFEADECPRSN